MNADDPMLRCGRMDSHDSHVWTGAWPTWSTTKRSYQCSGHVVVCLAEYAAASDQAEGLR
ncbi:MAG: hypothetical protein JWO15_3880 [Sphingomonadales bacterium]|nr:hypothetical protein [Sphingomonadales bacterium]